MSDQSQLITPLIRGNQRLEKKIDAWLDLLDATGIAGICALESDEYAANATAKKQLERFNLPIERAAEILREKKIRAVAAEPGFLAWSDNSDKPASGGRLESLTRRERQVARWLREGKSANEIGIILGISPRTVEKHIEKIYAKCGVYSHVEFIRHSLNEPA